MRMLSSTSSGDSRAPACAGTALAGSARRPSHSVNRPSGRLAANSQGQLATDKMAAATEGPAMDAVATTSELTAMPRPSKARG